MNTKKDLRFRESQPVSIQQHGCMVVNWGAM